MYSQGENGIKLQIKRIKRIICDGRRAVSHLLISVSILANYSRVERGVVYVKPIVKPIQSIPLILISRNYENNINNTGVLFRYVVDCR